MRTTARYGRWAADFPVGQAADRVEFTGPDGQACTRPVFRRQPAAFEYDEHGYETIRPEGGEVDSVRFTPDALGRWRWRALSGAAPVAQGEFVCEEAGRPGYVEISPHDARYFRYSGGSPYCAIGLNLCVLPQYPLAKGAEFERVRQTATLGARDYARWFAAMKANGANFARLWLGTGYLQVETETAGEHDLLRFEALDRVVELARHSGVRLKLCLENFRCFDSGGSQPRRLRHSADGRAPRDMDEWFQDPGWQSLWMKKVHALTARYGDDPVILAWELWNEINCCRTSDWAVQREWTRKMLPAVKALSPRNLVTNSIGSFDREEKQMTWYRDFQMPEMDFQQVHRYLDQGHLQDPAKLAVCSEPVAFSVDAIQRTRRPDRPVLLAETGGVNDNHSGPFRYYRADHRGLIFHDTTYPAFFAGAAGSGHIWHWGEYVDQKNLWSGYKALADTLAGVPLDREAFEPVDLSTDRFWFLALRGRTHLLAWVRNKADTWQNVLRDGREPAVVRGASVDLAPLGIQSGELAVASQWRKPRGTTELSAGVLTLPEFRHGLVLRVRHG
ncbi:MAG: cellulase family glycosylhydrolase [Kiritimatiellae bacterium]|nr:cellulase family glycosylhydrolase [Kiritimatiellia bacterium]